MKPFVTALLALAIAACGTGKAIFNVNAYSFVSGTGGDTIPYIIPVIGGSPSTVQKITLPPGFGKSIVDSVRIDSGAAKLRSSARSDTVTIGFALYFAADSASTYSVPAALTIPAIAVKDTITSQAVITGDLSSTVNNLFTQQTVWIRIAATGTNSGVTTV